MRGRGTKPRARGVCVWFCVLRSWLDLQAAHGNHGEFVRDVAFVGRGNGVGESFRLCYWLHDNVVEPDEAGGFFVAIGFETETSQGLLVG